MGMDHTNDVFWLAFWRQIVTNASHDEFWSCATCLEYAALDVGVRFSKYVHNLALSLDAQNVSSRNADNVFTLVGDYVYDMNETEHVSIAIWILQLRSDDVPFAHERTDRVLQALSASTLLAIADTLKLELSRLPSGADALRQFLKDNADAQR